MLFMLTLVPYILVICIVLLSHSMRSSQTQRTQTEELCFGVMLIQEVC